MAAEAGRIALVTGATKGIGLETARQLIQHGYTVIVTGRDAERTKAAAATINAEPLTLDVTSEESAKAAAAEVAAKHGKLDVLINNAGVMGDREPPSAVTMVKMREVFDANFFGVVAVTQAFLPLLTKSTDANIVMLSSVLGSIEEHKDPNSSIHAVRNAAYDASKAALNMYTVELAQALQLDAATKHIRVNAAHPGWVRTDMGGDAADLSVEEGAKTSVQLALLRAGDAKSHITGGFYHMGVHMRW